MLVDPIYARPVEAQGAEDSTILFVSAFPRYAEAQSGHPLGDYAGRMFIQLCRRQGVPLSKCRFDYIFPYPRQNDRLAGTPSHEIHREFQAFIERTNRDFKGNIIVALGNIPLEKLTGKNSISKWHMSLLPAIAGINCRKVLPLFDPWYVMRSYKDIAWLMAGAARIKAHHNHPELPVIESNYLINPDMSQIMNWLGRSGDEKVSLDIETSRGQITCIGLATDPANAICIPTRPGTREPGEMYTIMRALEGYLADKKLILQNFIYDYLYLARYGICLPRPWHDTMLAQKFLYPELRMGLDSVARFFTERPYWKDDGQDWRNVKDWDAHSIYNCKDTTGTWDAHVGQRADLAGRKLLATFDNYIMALTDPVREMCMRGLPVDTNILHALRAETAARIAELDEDLQGRAQEILGKPVNSRSPKQVKDLLTSMTIGGKNFPLPVKDGKTTTDKKAIKQLAVKFPEETMFPLLLELSRHNKAMGSYLEVKYDGHDSRLRFSINTHGTETGRFSCNKDPFDRGFNAQTVPKHLRKMFVGPEGHLFIQVDLAQAEARFVAWDAPEPALIRMYNDGTDIHSFVASRLFNKLAEDVTKNERQLGKKIGHGSNYGMAPKTFAITCLDEMGLQIPVYRARDLLEGYHGLFPGIRLWQQRIEEQVRRDRLLTTPMGRQRQFFGRMDENTFREAYAYRPQSAIPDIINNLMLHLNGHCPILLQVHDSLLLEVPVDATQKIITMIRDTSAWHPEINLAGGRLSIPVDIEIGQCWGALEPVT